jgi:hypothetical protein
MASTEDLFLVKNEFTSKICFNKILKNIPSMCPADLISNCIKEIIPSKKDGQLMKI